MLNGPELLTFDLPDVEGGGTHRMAVHAWGDPEAAETVVCVHGLTRNGRDFDYLAASLSERYRVLCPDVVGRGRSEWLKDPKGYSYPAYTADMLAFAKQANLRNVHWIGTSMGGIIGMMVANASSGILRSLTLNDIGCTVSAVGLKRIASYTTGAPAIFKTRAEAEAALRERCQPFAIRSEAHWQRFLKHSIFEANDGTFRFTCDPAISVNRASDDIKDVDLWPLWEKVKPIPVLLIRGENSDLLTAATAHKMKAEHHRLTYQEIAGAGHAPALMSSDEIGLVSRWVASLP